MPRKATVTARSQTAMQATGSTARPGSAALRAVIATSAKKHQRDEDQCEAEGGADSAERGVERPLRPSLRLIADSVIS